MRRTSFIGGLTAIALGGIFAFALRKSPTDLDLQVAGVIVLIAGAVDLLIRFLIADSPLLSSQTAAVAAVVAPLGEPVLDVSGVPISSVALPLPLSSAAPARGVPVPVEPVAAMQPSAYGPAYNARPRRIASARDKEVYDQALRSVGASAPLGSAVPLFTLTGRALRNRRRG